MPILILTPLPPSVNSNIISDKHNLRKIIGYSVITSILTLIYANIQLGYLLFLTLRVIAS